MKIIKTIMAAGLLLSTATIATGAEAQSYRHGDRYGHHDRGRDYGRHHGGRGYGWDRGRHYGWNRFHRRCWTEWRWHHRVRVCR